MEQFQLYMIAERKNRILNNEIIMKKLKKEIEVLKQKTYCPLSSLSVEYNEWEKRLKTIEEQYESQKDDEILYTKSQQIQDLADSIALNSERISFINCLYEGSKKNNIFYATLTSFKCFYKNNKQIYEEEKEDTFTSSRIVFSYLKQYFDLRKLKKASGSNTMNLMFNLVFEKEDMITKMEHLHEELDERRQIIRNYPKSKSKIEKIMLNMKKEMAEIINSSDYKELEQKLKEFSELESLNQIYQEQIINLTEISDLASKKVV